ncbi:MAG: hypothetical protein DSZ00_01190 [Gammaproteobacteria bacterium]|nr:MAG: hypothetical protein DSZ00_01190 [Gammaproteobacteria bacterium]
MPHIDVQNLHVSVVLLQCVQEMHDMSTISPFNTAQPKESANNQGGVDPLEFLKGDARTYTENLLSDWYANMLHLQKNKKKTCEHHKANMLRLLRHASVPPWGLKKDHVTRFFESRTNQQTGQPLSTSTVAVYCSSFRSFQAFALELDRVNEIVRQFGVRPAEFITEENSIGVKKEKSGWSPKSWALTDEQIDMIDQQFRYEITVNVINLRPNSLFCRKISSIHHHLKESEMNSVPAVPTTDQAVLPKII